LDNICSKLEIVRLDVVVRCEKIARLDDQDPIPPDTNHATGQGRGIVIRELVIDDPMFPLT
jgi:hypothetical protein